MLKELLSDDNFIFFMTHAFLIGMTLGITVCYFIIRNMKKALHSQTKAYEELLQSTSLEFPPVKQEKTKKHLQVIRMEKKDGRVTGLAI
jgi:hypothetical protein